MRRTAKRRHHTGKDGKLREKSLPWMTRALATGEVYGADEPFRFRTSISTTPRQAHRGNSDREGRSVRNKIVYVYDKEGKQTGYSVYDAAGKLIRRTPGLSPSATPASKRR